MFTYEWKTLRQTILLRVNFKVIKFSLAIKIAFPIFNRNKSQFFFRMKNLRCYQNFKIRSGVENCQIVSSSREFIRRVNHEAVIFASVNPIDSVKKLSCKSVVDSWSCFSRSFHSRKLIAVGISEVVGSLIKIQKFKSSRRLKVNPMPSAVTISANSGLFSWFHFLSDKWNHSLCTVSFFMKSTKSEFLSKVNELFCRSNLEWS